MKQILTILISFLSLFPAFSQNPLIFQVHEEAIMGTNEVNIDLKVSNFDSLLAYQFSILWDTLEMEFIQVNSYGPSVLDLNSNDFIVDGFEKGIIATLWLDPELSCVSLYNETTLLSFRFKKLEGDGKFSIANDPIFVEAVRCDGIIPEILFVDNYGGVTSVNDGVISSTNHIESDKISIFPNPAKDLIFFKWDQLQQIPEQALIYNLNGQLISQKAIVNQFIYLPESIVSGTYLIMFQKAGETVAVKKVHVQK